MEELEFGNELIVFQNVGQLKELLKNYSDSTPVMICGTPGIFYTDEETDSILLETVDCGAYDIIAERMEITSSQEYMDF